MNRRKALSIAGTVVATAAGGTLAIATNFGLLGFARADSSSLGALEADYPVATASSFPETELAPLPEGPPEVVVKYEDILVPSQSAPPAVVTPTASGSGEATSSDEEADGDSGTTTTTTAEVHDPEDAEDDEYVEYDDSFDDDQVSVEDPVEYGDDD